MSLSDKIALLVLHNNKEQEKAKVAIIDAHDVKEFIKELKREISLIRPHDRKTQTPIVLNTIDKLAGDKLI